MENGVFRSNNFDFLRLIFASLVIVSHSYPLTGIKSQEILMQWTNGQADFGGVAVKCFFIISGYLIYQSLGRSKSYTNFMWKRLLRLYPALIVMTIAVALIVPYAYSGEESIMENNSYFTYIPRTLSLYNLQHSISGVFEGLPYNTINGSLWTICYEFTMYLLTSFLFFIPKRFHLIIILLICSLSFIFSVFFPVFLNNFLFSKIGLYAPNFYGLTCFFFFGAALTFINFEKIKWKNWITLICLGITLLAIQLNLFSKLMYFILPVLVICFGVSSTPYINQIGKKLGDNSYGIYIYGWFIQQLLMYYFNLTTYPLMILSLIISYFVGLLSWHLIEKRALTYKKLFK